MRIRGLRKLRQATRWLQDRFTTKGLILMYHRIASADVDPWSLCVTPQHFAEHLQVLQKYTRPTSLENLAQAREAGAIPDRAVAITFDDGYANNLYNAKPILERYEIPATVFVSTGYTRTAREFWWDELEQVFFRAADLPERLCLTIDGKTHRWELGTAVRYSQTDYQRDRDRAPGQVESNWAAEPDSRLFLYYSVWEQLQPLPAQQRQQALDDLFAWAETEPVPRATHRPMTAAEICSIEQGGLVDVGAHTVTHPLLSDRAIEVQRTEIEQSKADLEKILEHRVESFAYPFGAYIDETVPLVKAAGFSYACSTIETTVRQYHDGWQLPRFEVFDWNGQEFETQLLRWLQK